MQSRNGLSPIIQIGVNEKGEFLKGKIYATKQVGRGGPILDSENKVIKEIISLTKEDIPESKLEISETGEISIKTNN